MSSEWRTLSLGELGRVVTGKTPKTSDSDNFGGTIPFVTPTDMDGRKVINSTARYLTEKGASTVKNSIVPAGTIMVSCIGSDMGKAVIAGHACVSNQQINSIIVDSKFSSQFVYYNLSMRKAELQHLAAGGSTMPILNKGNFSQIKIDLPSLSEQKIVAGFLSALDDRIILLRETNATLEAIAQAMFRSWFVDFDPVHAKQQGRAPEGMSEATAVLFPDSFEESELGLVPRGWRVSRVEDVAVKVGMGPFGSNIKVSTFVEQGVPVISGQHLRGTLMEDLSFNFVTEAHAEKLKNSCVGAGDVVFTHAGNIGQVSLIHSDALFDKYVLSQRQFFLRCNNAMMCPEWMIYFFRSPLGQHLLLANSSQVGVPSIARPVTYLRSIQFVLPPISLLRQFAEIADSLHRQEIANRFRIQTLATLRDTLLPRLISGQLRLPQAEATLFDQLRLNEEATDDQLAMLLERNKDAGRNVEL